MKKIILSFLLIPVIHLAASAQVDLTLYNMASVPQASYSNPASIPLTKYYIGMPGISSNYFSVTNSGFAVSDLIRKRSDDSLVMDFNNAISKMADLNFISHTIALDILSFGFRVKKNYISVNIT